MQTDDFLSLIGNQYTGKEMEIQATLRLPNTKAAQRFYPIARERLLQINSWHDIAGVLAARFTVTDAEGKPVSQQVQSGNLLKIDIPAPGNSEGDGYDWVRVEELLESKNSALQWIGFRVRPVSAPGSDSGAATHFYSEDATSTFLVFQRQEEVAAVIIDLNLKPNRKSDSLGSKIRNIAVGTGAVGFFSKIQWQGLVDGIVRIERLSEQE